MKPLKRSTWSRVMDHGKVIRVINTPHGLIQIYALLEKRGYQTKHMPKLFQYVRLPGVENGKAFYAYSPRFEIFWKEKGFI
jgi:hypothetical protein